MRRWYDGRAMEIQERTQEHGDALVSLTPAAAEKIRVLMAEDADVSVLRVAIEGGGCSGFQYGLGFDRGALEGDQAFECEGVTVVVDPFSAPYLRGATVDYLEPIQEYSAAKAALESHCRQLAVELAPRKIAVNAIRAGVTDTPALRKIPGNEQMIERCLAIHPAGRLTTPEDVASVLVALSCPQTVWLSGNVLGVDGAEDVVG